MTKQSFFDGVPGLNVLEHVRHSGDSKPKVAAKVKKKVRLTLARKVIEETADPNISDEDLLAIRKKKLQEMLDIVGIGPDSDEPNTEENDCHD